MKRMRDERGVSFVEVLAGTVVFLLMAGALAGSTVTAMHGNRASRDAAAAVALAHEWIEELRAREPWELAELEDGQEGPLDSLGRPDAEGRFLRRWTVTPDTPVTGTSLVQVTVSWGPSEQQQVETVAFVCVTPTCS